MKLHGKAREDDPVPWKSLEPPEGEKLVQWLLWLKKRPESVRKVVAVLPPWKVYRFKNAKAIYVEPVSIASYDEHEDGGVSLYVFVNSPLNPRRVFGVKPSDLEELPVELST